MLHLCLTVLLTLPILISGQSWVRRGTGPWVIATHGEPWPMPQNYTSSPIVYTLKADTFQIKASLNTCGILNEAIKRYEDLVFQPAVFSANAVQKPVLKVAYDLDVLNVVLEGGNCEELPYMDMDEAYTLTVGQTTLLSAKSTWGLLRGLETFSQLVYQTGKHKSIMIF